MRVRIASLYQAWMDEGLVRFMEDSGLQVDKFSFFGAPPEGRYSNKREVFALHLRALFKLIFPFYRFRRDPVLCLGGQYAWMVMTRLFGPVLPQTYHLFLYNFYLHALGRNPIIQMVLRYLLNSPKITVIAQSPQDQEYFSKFAMNPPLFIPYCEDDYRIPTNFDLVPADPYVFTGGYSNRDYEVVLRCAQRMPDVRFIVAASRLNKDLSTDAASSNVTIFQDLDPEQFHGLLEKSCAVIIPLKEDVGSSGQMVCLAAMRFARPVIYTDIPAVNYFFEGQEAAVPYRLGDVESLVEAVNLLRELPPTGLADMGGKLRQHFLKNYTKVRRNSRMLELITEDR